MLRGTRFTVDMWWRWESLGQIHEANAEGFSVSIQESQRHNQATVPTCPRCLKPMVLKGKRPMPFTNLAEETYRCETCGTETKRIIKDR
jgi:hypothetical protein